VSALISASTEAFASASLTTSFNPP
jgi:hypothetical protein